MKKLKIALLAPLTRPAEKDARGSRPKIVFDLASGLTKLGHEVTTFGTGDSDLPGKLIEVAPKCVYRMQEAENPFYQHVLYLSKMMKLLVDNQEKFDIIHSHLYPEVIPMMVQGLIKTPMVTTPHLYMWPELVEIFRLYHEMPLVSVSQFQKNQFPEVNFVDVVYNGIDLTEFEFNDQPEDYFLFFGRIKKGDPKGLLHAIEIAEKAKINLKIAGNVENTDFFETEIRPHLNDKIKFIGPIDAFGPIGLEQKSKLYRNAKGFFFTIEHVEAFGMTMIESMASGTPVVAFDVAAVREAIIPEKTGFILSPGDIVGAVDAVRKIELIDRKNCREHVEKSFSSEIMVERYLKVYSSILGEPQK